MGKHKKKRISKWNGLSQIFPAEYICWNGMIQRCYNRNAWGYQHWGGRGIRVCDRWKNDFSAFLKDMGKRPTKRHSIDRIDNEGNYEPENCKWSTQKEQANNTRRTTRKTIVLFGKVRTIKRWAEILDITYAAMYQRCWRFEIAEKIIPPEKWDYVKSLPENEE